MRPLDEVRAEVLAAVPILPPTRVRVAEAAGLVLAEDVVAREDVPPFANSAMDGYAVRAADVVDASETHPVRLQVVGELPAGRAPTVAVGAGEAIRIMTGAPAPDGADAVVMVERTQRDGDGVLVLAPATVGDHVREPGGDVRAGQVVLEAGTALGPAHIGVLAALGVREVLAHPRPRVAVLSTGDELVTEDRPLRAGEIRDSNRPMLVALVQEAGCTPVDLGVARDDEDALERTLRDAIATCDAIVTSGGVSVGDYDVVKAVLDRIGVLQWSQVAIRPAKPFAFGVLDGVALFGLPGNPVSSHVSFELFARPALRRMAGHRRVQRALVRGVAGEALTRRPDGKLHLDRVRVRVDDGRYVVTRSGGQGSNVLSAMAAADGLAFLPDGDGVAPGGEVRVLLLRAPDEDGAGA